MTFKVSLRTVLLSLSFSILTPIVSAQQSGQTGSTSTNANGMNATAGDRDSSSTLDTGNPALLSRRPPFLYIFGTVVMGDGDALPIGVVIQRSCNGRTTKEANVSLNGTFGFQLGANDNVIADPSMNGPAVQWEVPMTGSSIRWNLSQAVNGCDLSASLVGYKSSRIVLSLDMSLQAGCINAGTIFLYPAEKIKGTTVSVTDLAVPGAAKKAFARANKAIHKKQIDEAEKQLKAAVALYPKYAAAWLRLGQICGQFRRLGDARDALAKAIQADANYMNPYIELARLAATESRWQETADLTGHALELDPIDFPEAYYLNALANYNLDNLDAAERTARKLERIDSTHRLPQTQLVLASILDRKQDFAGEVDELRNYLKYAPRAANAGTVRSRLQSVERNHPTLRAAPGKQERS